MTNLPFGKKNDQVQTPEWIYESLNAEYGFDHDPCPIGWRKDVDPDGLTTDWGDCSFVNPPFSQIRRWVQKSITETQKGKRVVMLLTARINSKYWWELIWPNASEIRFIRGHVQFQGYEHVLPLPLCVVVFDPASHPLLWGNISKGQLSEREFIRIRSAITDG